MKVVKLFFALFFLSILFSCGGGEVKTKQSLPKVKLPPDEQGFLDRLIHAKSLIPDSLSDVRKQFLEDSLKTAIDQWLSKQTDLKANRWIGVVMNDTVGQSLSSEHSVLQLYIPVPKTTDTTTSRFDFTRSATITMSVDMDDDAMAKTKKQLSDGDSVVFSGYFTPLSKQTPDLLSNAGSFFNSPSLDFTPTELYKKGDKIPPVRVSPDTTGLYKSPISLTAKTKVIKESGDRFLHFYITVKNVSKKPIFGSTVQWMVTTKNGKPAKVDGATGIWLPGYFNQTLAPGASETEEWEYQSTDGEKVQRILPKTVTFYNGLQWKLGKH
ncbi:hypothetical protein MUY27_08675 [Mucilaginibacter sp. RS28]|uniref:Uncharacterized protein n=1 Tax=Mucilaginibacter straminoryzae TaxID=2932774 RepID=A0A9X1X3Q4_9SPHI|nr:hypothetical protein [Mucilaginibacter straminoryzae]MCJ8209780.1 hypothetical protein [Mucilaginibacter straminoryzae]